MGTWLRDTPMMIMDSGTVPLARDLMVSPSREGTGIWNRKTTTATSVAMRPGRRPPGWSRPALALPRPQGGLTPMEKSRMLKGMVGQGGAEEGSSPKMAWTTGKPTKTLFMKKMDSHATS